MKKLVIKIIAIVAVVVLSFGMGYVCCFKLMTGSSADPLQREISNSDTEQAVDNDEDFNAVGQTLLTVSYNQELIKKWSNSQNGELTTELVLNGAETSYKAGVTINQDVFEMDVPLVVTTVINTLEGGNYNGTITVYFNDTEVDSKEVSFSYQGEGEEVLDYNEL